MRQKAVVYWLGVAFVLIAGLELTMTSRGSAQIASDKAASIQTMVDQAYHAHGKMVRIPPGTYRITPPESGPHLQFDNFSDFEIDATGVTFLLTDRTRGGIQFRDCTNVTFIGATVRYEIPPFTQGTIEAIAPDGSWYDLRIDKGYPTDLDDTRYFPSKPTGYLFDRTTRWWKPGAFDLYGKRVLRLGPESFRFFWNTPWGPDKQPVAIGDLMAFRGSGEHNLTVINSARMHIDGVTIYNAGSFAVWESGGDGGNRYTALVVKRGPRPDGAVTDPLLSSTADAFHSSNVRKGPIVENSYLESMPDDGIAIHGTYAIIFKESGHRIVLNKSTFRPGDPIQIYDPEGHPFTEAKVLSVALLPGFHNTSKSSRNTRSNNMTGPYFTITLDRDVHASFDYLAENPSATGSGYIVRYNTIRHHRARGMLLKASNGLVEHNIIDGSTMGGIVLTPESWWNEAGYSRNVIVRDNLIRHVAYAPHQLGGVVIAALNGPAPVSGYGNQHIVFENNTLEDINGVNLLITSSKDVLIKNNRFLHPQHSRASVDGAVWGEKPGDLVFVTEAKDICFAGNLVEDLGKFNSTLIETSPSATADGEKTGVVIAK